MAQVIDRDRFITMLTERFPAVADDIDECARGLLHLEMAAFARATQTAISDQDNAAVKEYFAFVDEVFGGATPEVQNAVFVSYLEHLGFDGRRGKLIKARELLSPRLQEGLRGFEAYNEELFFRAKKGRPNAKLEPTAALSTLILVCSR